MLTSVELSDCLVASGDVAVFRFQYPWIGGSLGGRNFSVGCNETEVAACVDSVVGDFYREDRVVGSSDPRRVVHAVVDGVEHDDLVAVEVTLFDHGELRSVGAKRCLANL